MIETWRVILDFPDYKISNLGRVKSLKRKVMRILSPKANNGGYLYVILYLPRNSKKHQRYVHRLVVSTFGSLPKDAEVNHRDGSKTNNCISNLEACSRLENVRHAVAAGLTCQGERHHWAKLTDKQALFIRKSKLHRFVLAKKFNVNVKTIYNIRNYVRRKGLR